MKHHAGPTNPVSPNPNGRLAYSFNPMEDLPVAENAFTEHNFSDDYYTEPVFSSHAIYDFENETYDTKETEA